MCNECLQVPCHPRCPNADITPLLECDICGHDIYEGETIYQIDGKTICEECIEDSRTTAEGYDGF